MAGVVVADERKRRAARGLRVPHLERRSERPARTTTGRAVSFDTSGASPAGERERAVDQAPRPRRGSPPARAPRARSAGLGERLRAQVRAHPLGVDLEALERLASAAAAPPVNASASESASTPPASAGRALVLVARVSSTLARRPARARARAREHRARPGSACAASSTSRRRPRRAPRRPRSARAAGGRARSSPGTRRDAERAAELATGRRRACHGTTGSGRPSSSAYAFEHLEPVVAESGERAARAAELRREARRRAGARVHDADQPARRLEPERRRHGLLEQRARRRHRARCSSASLAHAARRRRAPRRSAQSRPRDERRRRVEDVLARRAVVHVLDARAAAARAARPDCRRAALARELLRVQPVGREHVRARARDQADCASAAASARSASSIASSHASSETASRSAGGTKSASNVKREEHRLRARPACGCRSGAAALVPRDQRLALRARRARERGSAGSPAPRPGSRSASAAGAAGRARRPHVEVRRVPGHASGSHDEAEAPSASVPQRAQRPPAGSQSSISPSAIGSPLPSSSRPDRPRVVPPGELVLGRGGRARSSSRADRSATAWSAASFQRRRTRAPRQDDVPAVRERPLRLASRRGRTARSAARARAGRGPPGRSGRTRTAGRPGKYICVTSRCVNVGRRPRSGCAPGRQAFSWLPHGYAPGLIVTKR